MSSLSALTLNQGTSKPRHTKFSSSTTDSGSGSLVTPTSSSASPKDNSGVAYYRFINSKSGTTCILLKTDALVEVRLGFGNREKFSFDWAPFGILAYCYFIIFSLWSMYTLKIIWELMTLMIVVFLLYFVYFMSSSFNSDQMP